MTTGEVKSGYKKLGVSLQRLMAGDGRLST